MNYTQLILFRFLIFSSIISLNNSYCVKKVPKKLIFLLFLKLPIASRWSIDAIALKLSFKSLFFNF